MSKTILKFPTYTANLRHAALTKENKQGRPFQIAELAMACDYSYEHMRKAMRGEVALGEEANDVICDFLGLPAREMWALAIKEKMAKKLGGYAPAQPTDPMDEQLLGYWNQLSEKQKETLLRVAEGMVPAEQPVHAAV